MPVRTKGEEIRKLRNTGPVVIPVRRWTETINNELNRKKPVIVAFI